jgi:hypothetical protein
MQKSNKLVQRPGRVADCKNCCHKGIIAHLLFSIFHFLFSI